MSLKVTLVGGEGGDVEAVLRACGVEPRLAPIGELEALAQPAAPQPDVVVLDLRAHAAIPPELTALKRQHATTGVVIVAKTLDPELILAAMRAGANECVAEPLTQDELDAAMSRVARLREPYTAVHKAFAIVGVKGGVGATSVAVNVATALARAATSGALLVDLHVSRGDAALYLGVEPRFSVIDALNSLQKLDDAYFRGLVTRGPSRLDLLAAPENGSQTRLDATRVRALLEFVMKHFEFTVVDVPRTDLGALEALDSMTSIVVVTTQELPAVRSAAAMVTHLRQRYGKERVAVAMTRLDRQSDITQDDVEKALGAPLAHVFPSDYRLTMASLNKGRPVVLDRNSALASSFEKFAHMLAGVKIEKKAASAKGAPKSVGWLERLTGRT